MTDLIEILVYTTGVAAYFINERRKNKKAVITPATLLATYKKSADVYALLSDVRDQFQCIRACVFQFQNGGKWHSGESIQRMSITHESKYYSLRGIKSKYQDILISADEHPYFGELLQYKIYSVGNIDSLPDGTYKNKLRSKNLTSQYYFLLEDSKTNRPLGMLVMSYPVKDGLNKIQILEVKEITRQISTILML